MPQAGLVITSSSLQHRSDTHQVTRHPHSGHATHHSAAWLHHGEFMPAITPPPLLRAPAPDMHVSAVHACRWRPATQPLMAYLSFSASASAMRFLRMPARLAFMRSTRSLA